MTESTRLRESFKLEVRVWAQRLDVEPAQIRIQRMKRKWASCSPKQWITFDEDLLEEPYEFQQYVIVHELVHLRVPNHGRLFRSLMSLHIPGWERWAEMHR